MAGKREIPGRWPVSTGLLTGYCAAAAATLVAVGAGGTRHPLTALVLLACVAAAVASRVTVPAAIACGGIAWLFFDGFVIGRHADLGWQGAASGWQIAACVGGALCGAAFGALQRAQGAQRAPALAGGARHRSASSVASAHQGGAVVISLAEARRRRSASARVDAG